jgi:hypothetical protein
LSGRLLLPAKEFLDLDISDTLLARCAGDVVGCIVAIRHGHRRRLSSIVAVFIEGIFSPIDGLAWNER